MKYLIYLALSCIGIITATTTLPAQLNINTTLSDEELVQSLAGPGIYIDNIVFDCPNEAYGWFECVDCNVGMEAGLILTSGSAAGANGPNNNIAATGNMTPGDADLDQIPGVLGTQDACSVAFDIQAASDTLKFNYVFGSEEYLEFVNSYNDVFAFFIEGPGVPFQNIALIPGTNTVVSINNVNNVVNPEYYVVNGTGMDAPYNSDDFYICYDGFTVVLEAKIAIIPCETYHLRLVVADDLDTTLDSGVFIQAGSIQTSAIEISATTSLASSGFLNAIEGCVDGIVNFDLNVPPDDTLAVYFEAVGTATNGVDYAAIPDSIVLYPGDTTAQLIISPSVDTVEEGLETIKIYVTNENLCGEIVTDSIELLIQDKISVEVVPTDTFLCHGQSLQYLATGAISYQWSPPDGLSAANIPFPVSTPTHSTDYMIIGNIGPCIDTTFAHIQMDDNFNPNIPNEYHTCDGVPITLSATGGDFVFWLPATNLSCSNCPNPVFSGTETTSYVVIMSYGAEQCSYTDSVTVYVGNGDLGLTNDTITLCQGEQQTLNLGTAANYAITPATGISCTDCPNPTITGIANTVYTVNASTGTCQQSATIQINVNSPTVNAGADEIACQTINTTLGAAANNINGATYLWFPTEGLSDSTSANPTLNYSTTTALERIYQITLTDSEGCIATDSVRITIDVPTVISIPQPDTIVIGNNVTLSVVGAPAGSTYAWSNAADLSSATAASTIAKPTATTTYTVTVTSPLAGCSSTASVTVNVILPPVLLVPSGFSPNGDGINDYLLPIGRDIAQIISFAVYNRWGQKVYNFADDAGGKGWNGKYKDLDQDAGVYVYVIEFLRKGETQSNLQRGNTTLVR